MSEPIRILTVERDSDTTASSVQSTEALKAIVLHSWNWPLSVPRGVNAQLMLTGQFTKADIARLKKQIDFLEESFDDETKEAAQ
jgi:hypothetical protein